eukprot:3711604-Prorocentrum_lima.AAC.1
MPCRAGAWAVHRFQTSAASALCGRPWVLALLALARALVVACARVWLISMPSDQARVCAAPQCWRASSSAILAVPMPSK